MKQFFAFLGSLVLTVITFATRSATPTATAMADGKPDLVTTIAEWFMSQTESIGPMLRTGGIIHRIDMATARLIATIVLKYSKQYGIKVSLLVSYIRGESDADPLAIDPNDQDAKPGETAQQTFEHSDLGLAQIDGSTLEAMPEFANKAYAYMEHEAYDPDWAINELCKIIVANGRELDADFAVDPTLLDKVPSRDPRVPKANAYNAGVHGTVLALRSTRPNLAYGASVIKRADELALLVDVAS